jgi:hypothetical protein
MPVNSEIHHTKSGTLERARDKNGLEKKLTQLTYSQTI